MSLEKLKQIFGGIFVAGIGSFLLIRAWLGGCRVAQNELICTLAAWAVAVGIVGYISVRIPLWVREKRAQP